MKIAIIGAGAMGSLFGARLAMAGEEVWLLDVWQEHIDTIRKHGLTLVASREEIVAFPRATTNVADIGYADLAIVFVKAYATREAAVSAKALMGRDTLVLTLQNGYGNAELLADALGAEQVLVGTTAQGATLLGPGRVLHGGSGETHIGAFKSGRDEDARQVAAVLSRAGFPTVVANDIASLIWGKLLINVGINALSAITGLKNGQLAAHEETRKMMAMAVTEAETVALAAGIRLPYPRPVEKVLAVAKDTAQNESSMLQDVKNQRRTEIDAINGAIVREGKKQGIAVPVNQMLTLLVKIREKNIETSLNCQKMS